MKHPRSPACPPPTIADRIPVFVRAWMQPFRACFTAPVWQHVLVLVMGAVLAPGKRTVTAALRVMGLDAISNFTRYHQVLNRARWSSRAAARCLLGVIVTTLLGIAGAFVATFLGQTIGWYRPDQGAGFIGAIVGAVIVLFIWNLFAARRA